MSRPDHPLNLFYDEPDGDRWLPLDRYPRRIIRRMMRGKPMIGGPKRWFLNLCTGLDRLGVPYRVNDYRYLRRHPDELACVLGKAFVVDELRSPNPVLFGPATRDHPIDDPNLFQRLPIRRIIAPCEWVRQMYEPYYGSKIAVWATGIDTDAWSPSSPQDKDIDVLVYDKVRWKHEEFEPTLIDPIVRELQAHNLRVETIRYGFYKEHDFRDLLARSRSMVFLCEHETQGIAYQQALACNVPLLAWDRGGFWQDPVYYPQRVQFASVSSVPYWDDRCGLKFKDAAEFHAQLERFLERLDGGAYHPRDYIVENLTLEKSAQRYLDIVAQVEAEL